MRDRTEELAEAAQALERVEETPRPPRLPCAFAADAKSLAAALSELRGQVGDSRRAYLWGLWKGKDAGLHSAFHPSDGEEEERLSEAEKDARDAEATKSLKAARQLLANLKAAAKKLPPHNAQTQGHREAVLDLLETYLKAVAGLLSEQQALRAKAKGEAERLSRLGALVRASRRLNADAAGDLAEMQSSEAAPILPQGIDLDLLRGRREPSPSPVDADAETPQLRHRHHHQSKEDDGPKREAANGQARMPWPEEEEEALSVEETPALAQENAQLYRRLNEVDRELEQLSGEVVGIGQLQEIFSEKILEQAADIQRIHQTTVHATENVKSGNQLLREAMQNRAGMRVWILFFLIVLTFTLWFLHWYNP